jgi:hypothetical protein
MQTDGRCAAAADRQGVDGLRTLADVMADSSDGVDVPVRFISLNRASEVGAADHFVYVRVVPDGREGHIVFACTLRSKEADRDEPVLFSPAHSESLAPRKGSRVRIIDVDRMVQPDERAGVSLARGQHPLRGCGLQPLIRTLVRRACTDSWGTPAVRL